MKTFKQDRISLCVIAVIALACMLVPSSALADGAPGSGTSTDPILNEGVVYDLPSLLGVSSVTAGDVVLCDGATCNSSTPTSQWSDVLVFYNSSIGPYVADSSGDADAAFIFSDSDGSLNTFLSLYNGLSNNAGFVSENPNGLTDLYGFYEINSSESTSVPEPSSLVLLCSGLFGVFLKTRRKAVA